MKLVYYFIYFKWCVVLTLISQLNINFTKKNFLLYYFFISTVIHLPILSSLKHIKNLQKLHKIAKNCISTTLSTTTKTLNKHLVYLFYGVIENIS